MANEFKTLDVLNSEGPIILARRAVNSSTVQLKFDGGGSSKITKQEFEDFIFNGSIIANPLHEHKTFIFTNFSEDMRASNDAIINFLAD